LTAAQVKAFLNLPQASHRPILTGAGAAHRREYSSVWDILKAAGWPIYPLLIASIIAVALIIERLIVLRKSKVIPSHVLNEVLSLYKGRGVNADTIEKIENSSPLGRVLAAGLRNDKSSRPVMKEAIEEAGGVVAYDLGRFLNGLGTIAAIAPLMGLFGTVVGMIEMFGSQSPSGTNPQVLAHGISVALYNTAFGLMIAIPSLMFYRYFRGLVDGYTLDMEQAADRLVPHLMRFVVERRQS
jgi:biopolymer transport protein ExbB